MNYDQLSQVNAGDNVVVRWPATGQETVVNYRGRIGNQAFVWTGTMQIAIAPETIIRRVWKTVKSPDELKVCDEVPK